MELTEKLQTIESINRLKQKIDTLDLTDQERELVNNWYKKHTAFFNEFVVKGFNQINMKFMFFLPKEILISCNDFSHSMFNELMTYAEFSTEETFLYVDDQLHASLRPRDTPEYNSENLLKFLEQLNKHKIPYTLLYQL